MDLPARTTPTRAAATWQAVIGGADRLARTRIAGRVGLATVWCFFAAYLLLAIDLPLWMRYSALAISVAAFADPHRTLLAVAALTGLGNLVGASVGLGHFSVTQLVEVTPQGAAVAAAIPIAFLIGWIARVLTRGEHVLRPDDRFGAPAVLLSVVVFVSFLVSAIDAQMQLDPEAGYRSAFPGALIAGLGNAPWVAYRSYSGALLLLQGLLLAAAALQLSRTRDGLPGQVARAIVAGAVVAGLSSCVLGGFSLLAPASPQEAVIRRTAAYLGDVNAAGSHLVLAVFMAGGLAWASRGRPRVAWVAALLPIVAGLWLTGSRSSALAGLALVLAVAAVGAVRRPWLRWLVIGVPVLLVLVIWLTPVNLLPPGWPIATTSKFRWFWLQTSARMWASAPVFGVGIGNYWMRSPDFMLIEVRRVFAYENAHNNFAQYTAELGTVGFAAIAWLLVSVIRRLRDAVAAGGGPVLTGTAVGLLALAMTCLTGHPLLVPPVSAIAFLAAGAALAMSDRALAGQAATAASADGSVRPGKGRAVLAMALPAVIVLIVLSMPGRAADARLRLDMSNAKYGFTGRFNEPGTGREYWLAGPDATFFVRTEYTSARIEIGGSETGQTVDVEFRVNGRALKTVRIDRLAWADYVLPLPAERSEAVSVRIDLKVTGAAGAPGAPAGPPRIRVAGMGGVAPRPAT
jgi:O-antigen ligase